MTLLVVMGSGETAPTMVKEHRAVLARSGVPDAGPAAMLDTTFGFQMNADDLVVKTQQYFAESVGTPVAVIGWRRRDIPPVEQEKALALLARSRWAFAGPGSPTYALRQWRDTPIPGALRDIAARGGTLVFGSAAACTVGSHSVPVYEIYKVGEEPHWEEGLDLLGSLTGIHAVVVPHFDNAEGGRHDTRFCYLGEQRLALLEAQLPEEIGVLGVDEHTALTIDLAAGTATASGNGVVTLRRRGAVRLLRSGQTMALTTLGAVLRGEDGELEQAAPAGAPAAEPAVAPPADSLPAQADAARARFDAALAARDVDGCVTAILDLEAAIQAWSTDSLQSEEADRARRLLRSLVVRLGELAEGGARDPADAVRPFVDLLLDLRGRARTGKDFATADLIRDGLTAGGLDIRDTPHGVTWSLG